MKTEAQRFWAKVIQGPRPNDCWLWTGAIADDGYGRFWVSRESKQQALRPQRFAMEQDTGLTLTADVVLMHNCDVPICVHATASLDSHLVSATQAQNMWDRSLKGRHANGASFHWRGVGRQQVAAQSRELRAALREHGWVEEIIRPMLNGYDPDEPTLF
ncbi:hypothetical protein ACX80B_17535 [Arthrobacter monumenti]